MLSSDNVITVAGNHIALQTKQIFILFHGPNEQIAIYATASHFRAGSSLPEQLE